MRNVKTKNGSELKKRVNKLIRAAKKAYPKVKYNVIIPGTWEYDATIEFFSPAKYEDKLDRVLAPLAVDMLLDEGYFIGALTLPNGRHQTAS